MCYNKDMRQDKFFKQYMQDNYPNAGFIRRWWERKKMEAWLKLPTNRGKETNGDFIRQIPD